MDHAFCHGCGDSCFFPGHLSPVPKSHAIYLIFSVLLLSNVISRSDLSMDRIKSL